MSLLRYWAYNINSLLAKVWILKDVMPTNKRIRKGSKGAWDMRLCHLLTTADGFQFFNTWLINNAGVLCSYKSKKGSPNLSAYKFLTDDKMIMKGNWGFLFLYYFKSSTVVRSVARGKIWIVRLWIWSQNWSEFIYNLGDWWCKQKKSFSDCAAKTNKAMWACSYRIDSVFLFNMGSWIGFWETIQISHKE